MAFAVVQKNLDPPTIEQLKNAFRGVRGLTPADAFVLGKDAFGVLVRGYEGDRAQSLQGALAAQGFETDVIDESELPALPQVRHVNRLGFAPEAVTIYDPLGRGFALEWKNVGLIAAGKVSLNEFKQTKQERQVVRETASGGVRVMTMMETQTKEQKNDRHLLEIVVRGGVLRYSVNADEWGHLLFQVLGERRTNDLGENFKLLVQDLTRFAPDVAVNRGAFYLRENSGQEFSYPSKNAFYEEMVWLLWKMK